MFINGTLLIDMDHMLIFCLLNEVVEPGTNNLTVAHGCCSFVDSVEFFENFPVRKSVFYNPMRESCLDWLTIRMHVEMSMIEESAKIVVPLLMSVLKKGS